MLYPYFNPEPDKTPKEITKEQLSLVLVRRQPEIIAKKLSSAKLAQNVYTLILENDTLQKELIQTDEGRTLLTAILEIAKNDLLSHKLNGMLVADPTLTTFLLQKPGGRTLIALVLKKSTKDNKETLADCVASLLQNGDEQKTLLRRYLEEDKQLSLASIVFNTLLPYNKLAFALQLARELCGVDKQGQQEVDRSLWKCFKVEDIVKMALAIFSCTNSPEVANSFYPILEEKDKQGNSLFSKVLYCEGGLHLIQLVKASIAHDKQPQMIATSVNFFIYPKNSHRLQELPVRNFIASLILEETDNNQTLAKKILSILPKGVNCSENLVKALKKHLLPKDQAILDSKCQLA